MKKIDNIRYKIDRFPKGYIFTYTDFLDKVDSADTIIKSLNRLAQREQICKISKGKFYKPEITEFGQLKPEIEELVKDLLIKDDQTIGYITGYNLYNSFGLTTQISNIIQIGTNNSRPSTTRAGYKISFIKQKNIIRKNNIKYLQVLDCIKYIKKIPDARIVDTIMKLMSIIRNIDKSGADMLIKLSLKYPPSTRALLGAMLEKLGSDVDFQLLRSTLNPISSYKFTEAEKVFGNGNNWNIR